MELCWLNAIRSYQRTNWIFVIQVTSIMLSTYPLTSHSSIHSGPCSNTNGIVSVSYEVLEHSAVPHKLGDLNQDLCINSYSIESKLLTSASTSSKYKFMLFPSSQPFYSYFEIQLGQSDDMKMAQDLAPSYRPEFLILRQSIDREQICRTGLVQNNPATVISNANMFFNKYDSNSKLSDGLKSQCNCNPLLGWCSIYIYLALKSSTIKDPMDENWETPWTNMADTIQFFVIEIRIVDINDNSPTFHPPEYKITVNEAEQPVMTFRLPVATDLDLGLNAQFDYEIGFINATTIGGKIQQFSFNQTMFGISFDGSEATHSYGASTNHLESNTGFLKVFESFDRERFTNYYVQILAIDKSLEIKRTGTLKLLITVADVNDMSPTFDRNHYVFNISEACLPGDSVGYVKADDLDADSNGQITYSLRDSDNFGSDNSQKFRIVPESGQIKVSRPLDRESYAIVNLRVEAKDHGQPPRTSLSSVTIYIEDVNDNSPSLTIWGIKENSGNSTNLNKPDKGNYFKLLSTANRQGPGHLVVSEYTKLGTLLAIVEATDPDNGKNGTVSCDLNDSHFSLVIRNFPDETTDILTRTRPKLPDQSLKTYHLVLIKPLDYEVQNVHYVPIVCSDFGHPLSKTSTTIIHIHIKDENDNMPRFLLPTIFPPVQWLNQHKYINPKDHDSVHFSMQSVTVMNGETIRLSIPETCPINHTIAIFSSHDLDSEQNARLHYQISYQRDSAATGSSSDQISELSATEFLYLDSKTGKLSLTKHLTAIPTNVWFPYEIMVQDNGIPALKTFLNLLISVTEVNSHEPQIELRGANLINSTEPFSVSDSSKIAYLLRIYENQPPGTPIGRLVGHDPDRGEAGRLTFHLVQCLVKTCRGSFRKDLDTIYVDPDNGIITTMRNIDRESDGQIYLLSIQVRDHGEPPKTASTNIELIIDDLNDYAPQFVLPPQPCGISSDNFLKSQYLKPKERCQIEDHVIFPSDSAQFAQTSTFNLTLFLPDYPNQETFYTLSQFRAIDFDSGVNSIIVYSLANACDQSLGTTLFETFTIDEVSGCLSLLRKWNASEMQNSFKFRIIAQDQGIPVPLMTIIEITVYFLPKDEKLLKVYINGSLVSEPCHVVVHSSNVNMSLSMNSYPTLNPAIRILLCIIALIGILLIIVICVIVFRQPEWFVRKFCGRNIKETAGAELLQCHEVHNQIDSIGRKMNFPDLDKSTSAGIIEYERVLITPAVLRSSQVRFCQDHGPEHNVYLPFPGHTVACCHNDSNANPIYLHMVKSLEIDESIEHVEYNDPKHVDSINQTCSECQDECTTDPIANIV